MSPAERAAYIEALVDQAPPLTTEQIARLRILLHPTMTESLPAPAGRIRHRVRTPAQPSIEAA